MRKLCSTILIFTILLSCVALSFTAHGEEESTTDLPIVFSLEPEHSEDKLIVVIRQEFSDFNKEYDVSDFKEAGVVELEWLSVHGGDPEEYPMLNMKYYCNILGLTIDTDKISLEKSIEVLRENPIIAEIIPNYILKFESLPTSYNISNSSNDPKKWQSMYWRSMYMIN